MSWKRFQNLLLKTNLFMLALGWIGFWGFGIFVGDIPPVSVILPLLALSACAMLTLSLALFVLMHLVLALKQSFKRDSGGADPRANRIAVATLLGIGCLVLLGFADHAGAGLADAILTPAAILIGSTTLVGAVYSLSAFAGPFLSWQFR